MYVNIHVNLYTPHVFRCCWRPKGSISPPRSGVTCGCELPDVGVGDYTLLQDQRVFFTVEPSVQLLCVGFVDQYHRNKSIDIYNWIFRFGYYSGTITSGVLVNIKQWYLLGKEALIWDVYLFPQCKYLHCGQCQFTNVIFNWYVTYPKCNNHL